MDVLVRFEDGTTEVRPADSKCRLHRFDHAYEPPISGQRGCRVSVLRGDEWVQCRVETEQEQIERLTRERDAAKADVEMWLAEGAVWQRKYDAAWMARDDARRIAVLGRKPLTSAEHLELRALVEQAKREGWL
jgi:hypothetical protein